jgi:hypothetical protein
VALYFEKMKVMMTLEEIPKQEQLASRHALPMTAPN